MSPEREAPSTSDPLPDGPYIETRHNDLTWRAYGLDRWYRSANFQAPCWIKTNGIHVPREVLRRTAEANGREALGAK